MATLKDVLRAADPISREPDIRDRRDRIRQRVIATTADRNAGPDIRRRRTSLTVTATLALIVAGVVGSRLTSQPTSLQAAVRFEVHLAEDQPAAGLAAARVAMSTRVVYIHPEAIVTNTDIASSRVVSGPTPSQFGIDVQLTADGAQKMRQATAMHIGRPVAILLDGAVVLAPTVKSAIGGSAMITGDYTRADADRIVNGMSIAR